QADYSATHSGGSLSTGGPVGKDLLTNMAGGSLSGANNSGHAEGTTKAGVSEGTLIVRDTDKQQQDVGQLNRDTEHANDGSISPIFNKEKEQKRLKQAQLIGEIGGQAMDVIRTQGDINGLKAALTAHPELKGNETALKQTDAYRKAMKEYGTGSDLQKAAQAVTGTLTALAGNNLAGALASGASPYLATEIKKRVGEDNIVANAMAHAVLGAVTAQLNNQSAAAGGLGAGGGELAARYIAGQLFPGKTAEQLSESEKQQVSALSQLAAGLAGGLATGDTAGTVTGGQAGKNAIENNYLSVSEKTELEIAKQTLKNSKDPAEREKAQQKYDALLEKDISTDKAVIAACSNGQAASAACAGERLKVIAVKGGYETGNYNNQASDMYPDAYGQIVNLLNLTSVDAQNQQQVKDAMVNYAMAQFGVDKATAENYIETYDGMKIVAASMTPVLGAAAANKISALGQRVVKESVPKNPNSSSAITDAEAGGYSYYDKFKNANGGWDWPKNLGFEGDPVKTTIPVGTRLDRYGEPNGSFLAPKGTPYEQRALAPGAKAEKYYEYEVIKPLPAIQGKIAPAFGEPGGGIQILPNMQDRVNVEWLLKNGYIREVR
ncbi:TPA: glycohydrolase toxin TNT-related protein, partial [Serratia marcescens]|nr:glycohydrolase toxin TNT-related protein [Serratia marcescens]